MKGWNRKRNIFSLWEQNINIYCLAYNRPRENNETRRLYPVKYDATIAFHVIWNETYHPQICFWRPPQLCSANSAERGAGEREILGKITQPHLWTAPMTYIAESSIKNLHTYKVCRATPQTPPTRLRSLPHPPSRPRPHHKPTYRIEFPTEEICCIFLDRLKKKRRCW